MPLAVRKRHDASRGTGGSRVALFWLTSLAADNPACRTGSMVSMGRATFLETRGQASRYMKLTRIKCTS